MPRAIDPIPVIPLPTSVATNPSTYCPQAGLAIADERSAIMVHLAYMVIVLYVRVLPLHWERWGKGRAKLARGDATFRRQATILTDLKLRRPPCSPCR